MSKSCNFLHFAVVLVFLFPNEKNFTGGKNIDDLKNSALLAVGCLLSSKELIRIQMDTQAEIASREFRKHSITPVCLNVPPFLPASFPTLFYILKSPWEAFHLLAGGVHSRSYLFTEITVLFQNKIFESVGMLYQGPGLKYIAPTGLQASIADQIGMQESREKVKHS